jgi:hypothetical protein
MKRLVDYWLVHDDQSGLRHPKCLAAIDEYYRALDGKEAHASRVSEPPGRAHYLCKTSVKTVRMYRSGSILGQLFDKFRPCTSAETSVYDLTADSQLRNLGDTAHQIVLDEAFRLPAARKHVQDMDLLRREYAQQAQHIKQRGETAAAWDALYQRLRLSLETGIHETDLARASALYECVYSAGQAKSRRADYEFKINVGLAWKVAGDLLCSLQIRHRKQRQLAQMSDSQDWTKRAPVEIDPFVYQQLMHRRIDEAILWGANEADQQAELGHGL